MPFGLAGVADLPFVVDFFAMGLWYVEPPPDTIIRHNHSRGRVLKISEPELTQRLLAWFDAQARALPWRDAPCGARNPYRVWLAEIMLQQTTVAAVIPYFEAFLANWPDVKALAAADDDDVMRAWAGLGYYARARNLLKCARTVAEDYQGAFPRAEQDLLKLPGVGPYTAAAVAAIAFNGPAAPVDGNVIRTLSRLYALQAEMPAGKDHVAARAAVMLPTGRSGDFAEALMDLGAGVCRPKNPDCPACPWSDACLARAQGEPTAYPKKAAKKAKPTRRGWAFWVVRDDGRVLLERRAEKGLLGGMMGFPCSEWQAELCAAPDAAAPWRAASWTQLPGQVAHTFTHFHLDLSVMRIDAPGDPQGGLQSGDGVWCAPDALERHALPSVMKKVARLVRGGGGLGGG